MTQREVTGGRAVTGLEVEKTDDWEDLLRELFRETNPEVRGESVRQVCHDSGGG